MKKFFVIGAFVLSIQSFGQKHYSAPKKKQVKSTAVVDTTYYDYDKLFSELDQLLDSLTKPRSFGLADASIGNSLFDFFATANDTSRTLKKWTVSPSLAYFDKTGLGVSAQADVIDDGNSFTPYQFALSGFFDYLKNKKFITGVSFLHYFTKSNLAFYTSPLDNELQAYFTYRQYKVKPSVSVRYGMGSEDAFVQQEQKKKNQTITQTTTTHKSIADFNVTTSVRYDHYWLDVFSKKDYIKFTPQINLLSGSQKYGFNQVSNITTMLGHSGKNISSSTEEVASTNSSKFEPLSLTSYFKTEYSKGKFFVQPQVIFDYSFVATKNNINTFFVMNTGFVLY